MFGLSADRKAALSDGYQRVAGALRSLAECHGVVGTSDWRSAFELWRLGVLSDQEFTAFDAYHKAYERIRFPMMDFSSEELVRFVRLSDEIAGLYTEKAASAA